MTEDTGVYARPFREFRVLEVDTKKAVYKGHPYRRLSDFERRKFENLLVIKHSQDRLIMLYDGERKLLGNPK